MLIRTSGLVSRNEESECGGGGWKIWRAAGGIFWIVLSWAVVLWARLALTGHLAHKVNWVSDFTQLRNCNCQYDEAYGLDGSRCKTVRLDEAQSENSIVVRSHPLECRMLDVITTTLYSNVLAQSSSLREKGSGPRASLSSVLHSQTLCIIKLRNQDEPG